MTTVVKTLFIFGAFLILIAFYLKSIQLLRIVARDHDDRHHRVWYATQLMSVGLLLILTAVTANYLHLSSTIVLSALMLVLFIRFVFLYRKYL